jgi:hypothetical protein
MQTMMKGNAIPQGLRTTYLIAGIIQLILGLAGTFAAKLVGDIAGHQVHDFDVNFGLGVTTLGLAIAAFFAYRATRWHQITLLTFVNAFVGFVGGIGSLILYFAPGIVGAPPFPPVTLVVALLNTVLGGAFAYFYLQVNGGLAPKFEA